MHASVFVLLICTPNLSMHASVCVLLVSMPNLSMHAVCVVSKYA